MRLKVSINHPEIQKAIAAGIVVIPDEKKGKGKKPSAREFVVDRFLEPATFEIPVETVSEANAREWRGRSKRTGNARIKVCRSVAKRIRHMVPFIEAYHAGRTVYIRFTRLGVRRLDPANLGGSLKASEDALALTFGANDGDLNWQATFAQEVVDKIGIRIELSLKPFHG